MKSSLAARPEARQGDHWRLYLGDAPDEHLLLELPLPPHCLADKSEDRCSVLALVMTACTSRGEALVEWFGRVPRFHDAELLEITFSGKGAGLLASTPGT